MDNKNVVSTQIRLPAGIHEYIKQEAERIERECEIKQYFLSNGIHAAAKRYDLSRVRIYQIVNNIDKRKEVFENRKFVWLTVRINNILKDSGFSSIEDLRNFYKKRGRKGFLQIRNIGEMITDCIISHISEQEVI